MEGGGGGGKEEREQKSCKKLEYLSFYRQVICEEFEKLLKLLKRLVFNVFVVKPNLFKQNFIF